MPDPDPLTVAQQWHADGRDVAIATVLETWSSAPRPAGSHLVIDSKGNFHGSISGGCVEEALVAEAGDVIASGKARIVEFGVSDDTARKAGLYCGGHIRIYVERLGTTALSAHLQHINAARAARRAVVTVTALDTGDTRLFHEGEAFDPSLGAVLVAALRTGKSGLADIDGRSVFINVHLPPPRIVAIGAGHISRALASMAAAADFELTIIDPRGSMLSPSAFGSAHLLVERAEDVFQRTPLDAFTALAAVSHDPDLDDFPLMTALAAGCFYVGALGGKKSHAKRMARLTERGVEAIALARIHGPIGLDIRASNPAEIAVSILADIILTLRTRNVGGTAGQGALTHPPLTAAV